MKRILLIALIGVFMTSCGVGSYTMTSGLADESSVTFVADDRYEITVTIDDKQYDVETVKLKDYRKDRSIKRTVANSITITPGTHKVGVVLDGEVVYTQDIFVTTGESKIIEL